MIFRLRKNNASVLLTVKYSVQQGYILGAILLMMQLHLSVCKMVKYICKNALIFCYKANRMGPSTGKTKMMLTPSVWGMTTDVKESDVYKRQILKLITTLKE